MNAHERRKAMRRRPPAGAKVLFYSGGKQWLGTVSDRQGLAAKHRTRVDWDNGDYRTFDYPVTDQIVVIEESFARVWEACELLGKATQNLRGSVDTIARVIAGRRLVEGNVSVAS